MESGLCIPVWISPMGSRPSFCRNCKKFLTSAIIKWWFSTSTELRKMTTWYCYKMKIGIYHEVTWRGKSTTTKWRLVFIVKLLEGDTPPLQNEDLFFYMFLSPVCIYIYLFIVYIYIYMCVCVMYIYTLYIVYNMYI